VKGEGQVQKVMGCNNSVGRHNAVARVMGKVRGIQSTKECGGAGTREGQKCKKVQATRGV